MKLISLLFVASVSAMPALQFNFLMAMKNRAKKFNDHTHGKKRKIIFDPAELGCKLSSQRRLDCGNSASKLKKNSHFTAPQPSEP